MFSVINNTQARYRSHVLCAHKPSITYINLQYIRRPWKSCHSDIWKKAARLGSYSLDSIPNYTGYLCLSLMADCSKATYRCCAIPTVVNSLELGDAETFDLVTHWVERDGVLLLVHTKGFENLLQRKRCPFIYWGNNFTCGSSYAEAQSARVGQIKRPRVFTVKYPSTHFEFS